MVAPSDVSGSTPAPAMQDCQQGPLSYIPLLVSLLIAQDPEALISFQTGEHALHDRFERSFDSRRKSVVHDMPPVGWFSVLPL